MKKIWGYNKFNFVTEFMNNNEDIDLITEDTEFNQYQFGAGNASPLGPGYGFAVDPSLSIYSDRDSPYTDLYSRTSGNVKDLMDVIDFTNGNKSIADMKFDHFIDDVAKYTNLKILRIAENKSGYMNVYISFDFEENEYFGIYKDYNKPYMKPVLDTELVSNRSRSYMDKEYYMKLDNYLYKILENWFTPKKGFYKNFKDNIILKDTMGQEYHLKKNKTIELLGQYDNENSRPYLELKINGSIYTLSGNNYYYYNYWFEKLK